jgi:hypothetical protein
VRSRGHRQQRHAADQEHLVGLFDAFATRGDDRPLGDLYDTSEQFGSALLEMLPGQFGLRD